jgi:hypothetical protein
MRRTYFRSRSLRTGPLPVMRNGPIHRKYDFVRTHILLTEGHVNPSEVSLGCSLRRPRPIFSMVTGTSHPRLIFSMVTGRKTQGEKSRACAEPTSGQGHLRTGPLPVTWLCHFRSKGPIRADMSQLPVAHAQNILPDSIIPVTWLTSLPVISLPVMSLPVHRTIHRKYDFVRTHILLCFNQF